MPFKISSFIPFLNFWLMPLLGMFAAGADAAASVGGDASAILEGGGDVTEGGETDAGGEGGEPGAAVTEEGEPEEGAEPGAAKPAVEAAPDLAKPLSKEARSVMKELKTTNPVAWKEINSRLWALNGQDQKIMEAFPEKGLEQAIALKTDVENFLTEADAENLGDVRAELNDFRTTDAKIIKGDPTFVRDLPQNVQAGIYNMLPHFVQEWAARDQDGYERYFAGIVDSTLRETKFAQNMEMALWKLEEMGLDDPTVKKVHDLLSGNLAWMNKMREKSTAPPVKKAEPEVDARLTAREQSVAQQERQIARQRVAGNLRKFSDPKMLSILAGVTGGKIPGNVNKAEVLLRAHRNLAVIMGKPVSDKISQYLDAKDEDGCFRYTQSQMTEHRMTKAVQDAYTYLYGTTSLGGKKPAAEGGAKPGEGGAAKPSQFATINYNPKPSSIDFGKTDALAKSMNMTRHQLIGQNKAVLKNGKKVTWSREAENEQ